MQNVEYAYLIWFPLILFLIHFRHFIPLLRVWWVIELYIYIERRKYNKRYWKKKIMMALRGYESFAFVWRTVTHNSKSFVCQLIWSLYGLVHSQLFIDKVVNSTSIILNLFQETFSGLFIHPASAHTLYAFFYAFIPICGWYIPTGTKQNQTKPNNIYNSWTTAIHQNVSLLYYIQSNIVHLLEFSRSRWIWIWTNFSSRFYPVFCMRWLTITETLCGLHF